MKTRHQILDDQHFWLMLEFNMSGWFAQSCDEGLRKYWIDGFVPESIVDTKCGVEVIGAVWIAEGQKNQTKCRFLARVPQTLLHRTIRQFDCQIVCFDIDRKYLDLNIWKQEVDDSHRMTS